MKTKVSARRYVMPKDTLEVSRANRMRHDVRLAILKGMRDEKRMEDGEIEIRDFVAVHADKENFLYESFAYLDTTKHGKTYASDMGDALRGEMVQYILFGSTATRPEYQGELEGYES